MSDYYDYELMNRRAWRCREEVDPKWVNPNSTREKHDPLYSYSYSEFFHFGSRSIIKQEGIEAVYDDRLWQWDYEKTKRLKAKHCDVRWECATSAQLDAFMSAYQGEPCEVVALAEGCNVSSGYAYYIFWFRRVR